MLSFSEKYIMYPKKLGEGGGGVVYEGKEKQTGRKVAVKLIRKSRTDEQINKRLLREVEVMRVATGLGHKYVMALHDFYEESFRYILVLQYVPGGDLFDRIIGKERYSEHDARGLLIELIEAVRALHSINILHRDIKPENVLMAAVDNDSEILLGDFGLATISEVSLTENHVGTLQYRAPEMFTDEPHFKPSDVWSIGAVLFVLLSGTFPFDDSDENRIEEKITKGELKFPEDIFVSHVPYRYTYPPYTMLLLIYD
jgi:serine/threonine protein kinase